MFTLHNKAPLGEIGPHQQCPSLATPSDDIHKRQGRCLGHHCFIKGQTIKGFLIDVLFLLLMYFPKGQADRVMALVGDDVTLSINTNKLTDISKSMVEWTRMDRTPNIVHLHKNLRTIYAVQNPAYRRRTTLSAEDLNKGIISLTLSRVQMDDEGNYTCWLSSTHNKYTFQLLVGAASYPVLTLVDVNSGTLVLGCRANGWYPQPNLSWCHTTEGHPLPAATMNTTQDPNGLYNIYSTVAVERSQSRPVICRVHQEPFNQTREMEIQLPDNLFVVCRYIPGVLAGIGIPCGVFLVAILIVFRNPCVGAPKKNQMYECVTEGQS